MTPRDGLRFHDAEPVRARAAAARLQRWMKRSGIRQELQTATEELSALDDRRLRFRLRRPFPPLLAALGCFYSNTALRRGLADRIPGPSLFWNIRRA